MATLQESSSLFAVFILTIMALFLVPYTIFKLCWSFTKKTMDIYCQCSQCLHSEKYRKSFFRRVSNFLTCSNLTVLLLWITMIVLIYYIEHISHEIQPFEPFNILGLEPGASELAIKKAYRRLSIQYHPDKNSNPEAHKYFVEYISKAYQALTDPTSRDNFLKYGHPDGRQGFQIGIALPEFLLNFGGESGGFLLLCMVGTCVLLPLVVAIICLSRSSKYARNFVMHQTQLTYDSLMKPSLVQRKVLDVFIKAAEFMEISVCKGNDELLQKLFMAVKSELNLELTNLKSQEAKFWRRHPSFIKTELLIHAHLTRAAAELHLVLRNDYRRMLEVAPRLLEELMKIAVKPRSPHGHGWLKPAVGVLQLAQCITQAVPLSARKASSGISGGIAPFLQLPHLNETTVKKIVRKKECSFGGFRGLSVEERKDLLTEIAGLSAAESQDVESVLEMIPSVAVEVTCVTEGEKCIREGDLVTVYAWIMLQRNNGLTAALPHAPYYPFHKEENFWFLLADSFANEVWMSRKVSFMDEASAVSAASMAIKEKNESLGFSSKDVDATVRAAIGKVKSGSRLVLGTFRASREGKYNLIAYCFSDSWIGCDVERAVKLEVLKGNRAGKRGRAVEERALGEEDVEEGEEEEEEVILEGDDHASDYSDDYE